MSMSNFFTESESEIPNSQLKQMYDNDTPGSFIQGGHDSGSEIDTTELKEIIDQHQNKRMDGGFGDPMSETSADFVTTDQLREILKGETAKNFVGGNGGSNADNVLNTEQLVQKIEEHNSTITGGEMQDSASFADTSTLLKAIEKHEAEKHGMTKMIRGEAFNIYGGYNGGSVKYTMEQSNNKLRVDFSEIDSKLKKIANEIEQIGGNSQKHIYGGGYKTNSNNISESINHFAGYKRKILENM